MQYTVFYIRTRCLSTSCRPEKHFWISTTYKKRSLDRISISICMGGGGGAIKRKWVAIFTREAFTIIGVEIQSRSKLLSESDQWKKLGHVESRAFEFTGNSKNTNILTMPLGHAVCSFPNSTELENRTAKQVKRIPRQIRCYRRFHDRGPQSGNFKKFQSCLMIDCGREACSSNEYFQAGHVFSLFSISTWRSALSREIQSGIKTHASVKLFPSTNKIQKCAWFWVSPTHFFDCEEVSLTAFVAFSHALSASLP